MEMKYIRDKERMDQIADKLATRQDIWQDRYIYWIAVAIGHILEWMVKHEKRTDQADTDSKVQKVRKVVCKDAPKR
jgi:hypothetical protein